MQYHHSRRGDVASTAFYELEKLHSLRDPLWIYLAFCVSASGLFLTTDFTGPGVAMKRGRRQEPRITA